MKISPITQTSFSSNNGYYKAENGNSIGTYTKLFRADLDWERFTEFMVKHFKNKENVQIIQFASSDGSEAYTQIITLLENHKNSGKFFPIQAYDVNEKICKTANSGLLNISRVDKKIFEEKSIDFNKYFAKTERKLLIENDTQTFDDKNPTSTYKVLPVLKDKVNFHTGDMFNVIKKLDDNSNSVILCRNVLDYLSYREADYFTTLCACKLKKGSLIAVGEIDKNADLMLQSKGFIRVMPNIYMQT